MPRPETSSDIPLQFSGQAPLATTPLIPLLPFYLTTITATPSTEPSDRSRGSVPGQPLYVRIERVTPPKRVLRSNGGRPKIRYEFIPVSDGSGDEVTRSSRRDEKRCVAEETSPVAGASGPRRGKGEAAVTAPAAAPKKRRGRGRLPRDSDPERLAREYRNGGTPTPAVGRIMVDVITITSSSPVRGVSDIEDNTAALAVALKKRRGRPCLAADKAAEQLAREQGDRKIAMAVAGRGVVMETEDSTASNDRNITNGKVDAATNTSPPSRGSTRVDIEGHRFDVPADPVECWEAARQQVVWSYRAVIENGGTARDVAAVMGTLKRDGGSSVGGGAKRTAGGDERDEGKIRKVEGREKKRFCRDLQAQKEGRADSRMRFGSWWPAVLVRVVRIEVGGGERRIARPRKTSTRKLLLSEFSGLFRLTTRLTKPMFVTSRLGP